MEGILIKNARIVNEGRIFMGNILCKNGVIEKVSTGELSRTGENYKEIEADGKFLLPGVIDDQVHFREPGMTHKGDIATESRAAIAGGITSYMEMPNTRPPATTLAHLDEKFRIAGRTSFANYSFYLGATNDNINDLLEADPSLICGIKVFMGSSTGNMLVDDEAALRDIFSKINIPVAVHCEDEHVIRANTLAVRRKYGDNVPVIMHPAIRSEEACYKSSSYAVELAREYGTRLHVLHISTARELELFDSLTPVERKKITSEVCIHHLWFDQHDYSKFGSAIKWNPAIKTRKDKEALIMAVTSGKIDIIATDHAPHTQQEKSGTYFTVPSGGPMVQHALVAMMELVKRGRISLEKVVEKMCHTPAIVFNIHKRGFIREGYFADLVLVDPDSEWEVKKENLLYKCGWSPMEGQLFSSKVTHTIVNGHLVYDNGKINDQPRGLSLTFDR
jgi:dihydroorotase